MGLPDVQHNSYCMCYILFHMLQLGSCCLFPHKEFFTRRQLSVRCYASFDPLTQTTKSVLSRGVTSHETLAHSWEP